jgi:hypothetical protein
MKINTPNFCLFVIYMLSVTVLCENNQNTFAKVPNPDEKKKEMVRKIIIKVNKLEDLHNKIDEIKRKLLALGEYQRVEFKYGNSTETHSKGDFDNIMNNSATYVKAKTGKASNMVYRYTNNTKPMNATLTPGGAGQLAMKDSSSASTTQKSVTTGKPGNSTVYMNKGNTQVNATNTQGKLGNTAQRNATQPQKQKKPVNNKIPIKFAPTKVKPNPFAQITHINVINYYLQRIDNLKNGNQVAYPIIQVVKKQSEISLILNDSVRV